MHVCEEFRERLTERIIDREDVARTPEFQRELMICSRCAEFYAEAKETIEAISSVDFSMPEEHWQAMTGRLRSTLASETIRKRSFANRASLRWGALVAAAALLLITAGVYRFAITPETTQPEPSEYTYVDRAVLLDPVTVDFLEDSELLLRNVMKIQPNDMEDLADAKRAAANQLIGIDQRKDAAAEVPPVVSVMDTYETILRDIRNLNEDSMAEDIGDIQNRIQSNALIANMKAFQPALGVVSAGLR